MATLPYFDRTGRSAGVVEIDEKIFGERVRAKLLHQVVVAYENNRRQGTHQTKRSGEVEGSNRKPWPQKHTGRARAGKIRSPIWRKGGHGHARRPRDYSVRLPRRIRHEALNSAFLGKIRDGELRVIEGFSFEKPRTREMAAILKNIGIRPSILIGIAGRNENARLSARNLPKVSLKDVREFNAYEVLKHKQILLTRDALVQIVQARNGRVVGPTAGVAEGAAPQGGAA